MAGLLSAALFAGMVINAVPSRVWAADTSEFSGSIPLRKESGSGSAFMYYHFKEITEFQHGTTYALLDGVYSYEQAVTKLGAGAVLQATDNKNNCENYMRSYAQRYGWADQDPKAKAYVKVVSRGKGFDSCPEGGLYRVPDSGVPAEYRYFCRAGGAQNCGPLYAYTYETEALSYENVSASLNSIEKRGSDDPADYTVTLTYGSDGGSVILAPSGYSVEIPDPSGDRVIIVVEDDSKHKITAEFTAPLAVCYDGNAKDVTDVPDVQGVWRGDNCTLSEAVPGRRGYAFDGWKDENDRIYQPGEMTASMSRVLRLSAQWRDTQPPEFDYTPVQVETRTTDREIIEKVKASLTVTDNEPAEECTVSVTGTDIAVRAGSAPVMVTVTDQAGNRTTKQVTVDVTAKPVGFTDIGFTESSNQLQATLSEPGSDPITETGFVWGVMNNPTTVLHNGQAKTASPVTAVGGRILVDTGTLSKGVTYYARAYAIADGVTYYGNEISFGIGLPAYGTFTIRNNNNNTFTVTRTGGTAGKQTVYYRTVNGSATGGTHFTHQAATLVFNEGETSKTITIAEAGVTQVYNNKTATRYANADRTYQVELYRVTGGANLGASVRATRTMARDSNFSVERAVYANYREEPVYGSDGVIFWGRVTDKGPAYNPTVTFSMQPSYGNENLNAYLKNTIDAQALYLLMDVWEEDDGNQEISFQASSGYTSTWHFEIKPGEKGSSKRYNAHFPSTSSTANDVKNFTQKTSSPQMPFVSGEDYLSVPVSETTMKLTFDASGNNADDWRFENTRKYTKPLDTKEPQLLSVAPMAGGIYKTGDPFTVALIFDEIVDKANSTDIGNVTLNTSWGQARYSGGADTNILYFSGTVTNGAGSRLEVRAINNAGSIKDMCEASATACSGGTGNVTASVDTSAPNLTLASKGIASGTGIVNVTVNDDKAKTSAIKYAWSDTAAMPAAGWVEMTGEELNQAKSGGLSLAIRKEAGSGSSNGKWYLHVMGTYETTGATTYKSQELDFGTKSAPAAGSVLKQPSLEVFVNNNDWARSRDITVTASGQDGLRYRLSGKPWQELDKDTGKITVTENGYYTFLLTAGDQTVTKSVKVEKIDRTNPAAEIGGLLEDASVMSAKEQVYTKITLPLSFRDTDSGVKAVQYAWTDSAAAPASWQTLDVQESRVSCTADTKTEITKYLHLKVTDQAGNVTTAVSEAYRLISKQELEEELPGITLEGAPEKWTNDGATLSWKLTDHKGKAYTVTQPDGVNVKAQYGSFLVNQNGTYTVTLHEDAYGGQKQASVRVDKFDYDAPAVTADGIRDGYWNGPQTVTLHVSDSQSGVGKALYKVVKGNSVSDIPEESELSAFTDGQELTFDQDGVYYIYYKCCDNAGDDTIGRAGNIAEGFIDKPIRIDQNATGLTVSGGTEGVYADIGLTLKLEAAWGASGGTVSVGDVMLDALTAEAGTDRRTMEADYTVTAKGTYIFRAVSGTGQSAEKSVNVYQADFDAQGGNLVKPQLVAAGGWLKDPGVPQREGYTFDGWYTASEDGSLWDFPAAQVEGNTVLYAHYTANQYTVSFDYKEATGGNDETGKTVVFDSVYGELPEPQREGFHFEGWYTQPSGDIEVTEDTVVTTAGDHTLYAKWSDCQHEWDMEHFEVKEATCTEGAAKIFTCIKCHDTMREELGSAIGHNWGEWASDAGSHWHACANCGERRDEASHTEDGGTVTKWPTETESGIKLYKCAICGREIREESLRAGEITKEVEKGQAAPDTAIVTAKEELADICLTEDEKVQIQGGTEIKLLLTVEDAGNSVSDADRQIIMEETAQSGYQTGMYLDVNFFKIIGEERTPITETREHIRLVMDVPDILKAVSDSGERTYSVIRIHDGETAVLEDLDNDKDTITIETNRFSTYAIIYKAGNNGGSLGNDGGSTGSNGGSVADNGAGGVPGDAGFGSSGGSTAAQGQTKDDEPDTGEHTGMEWYATEAMIAGFAYLLVYFTERKRGMTEEEKNERIAGLVRWARRGGRLRRLVALAAIFVLLLYYHSVGKKTALEWKAVYGK